MSMEAVKEMLGYAQYQSYRESGVPTIGRIPTEWDTIRLKYGATINDDALNGSEDPDMEIQYVDITSVEFGRGIVAKETMRFGDSPSRARRLVRDGDVIVSTVRTYLKSIAPIVRPDKNLVVSTGFAVLRPSAYRPEFLRYVLESEFFLDEVAKRSVGVSYPGINASQLGDIFGVLPPLPEQTHIAAFLDRKCGQIDQAIAQKERLIALLKERRQVLVQQAVTKGLNPKARMKNSGVAWLGEVPEHWRMVRIKHMAKGPGSLFMDGDWIESPVITEDGIRYITTGNVGAGDYKEQGGGHISEDTFRRLRCTEVFPGDLLISRLNEPIGRACIIPDLGKRIVTAVDNVILRPSEEYYKPYLMHFMNSPAYAKYTSLLGRGATMSRISRSQLGDIPIAVPPKDEQMAIAKYLDVLKEKDQQADHMVTDQIAKLKEYRSILINAAVTGKIKVPEV